MIHSTKTILLVEDNPDDQELTIRALSKNMIKNEVVIARDGAEALDYLFGKNQYADRDITELPQVILLDLNLPKINGLDVLRQIRSSSLTQAVPVIILTSSKEEQDIIDGYKLGSNSYIQKPVDFVEFVEAVQVLGLYWLLINSTPSIKRSKA